MALGISFLSATSHADQLFNDDIIVKASLCVGQDCVSGENFNFDTIRMKENNTRIKFQDTSVTSSFPKVDWQLTANSSANGGKNYFAIENIDLTTIPFMVESGAGNYSLFVRENDWIGFNTNVPAVTLQVTNGNSPTLRLDQDGSSGFAAQAWDVGGNETNFFVRDVNNNSSLPLRISAGATNASIFVAADGDVGFETTTPDGMFDIAHPSDVNNHAVLLSSVGYFGINIDNGFSPLGLFDVQTTGGKSRFMVQADGDVGVGTATPVGRFEVKDLAGTASYFDVDASGNIGIGTSSPGAKVEVASGDLLISSGQIRIGSYSGTAQTSGIDTQMSVKSAATKHTVVDFDTTDTDTVTFLAFSSASTVQWSMGSRNSFPEQSSTFNRFAFHNSLTDEVMTIHQSGNVYIGHGATNNNTIHQLEAASGAHLTTGGVWTSVSSREKKKNIREISMDDAESALTQLTPVQFEYLAQPDETYAGFISEDVPDIVATNDRKSLATMDIVAVLTRVVQKQQDTIEDLNKRLKQLETE